MGSAVYWRDFDLIHDNLAATIISCHTYNAINNLAVKDLEVWQKMNRYRDFCSSITVGAGAA